MANLRHDCDADGCYRDQLWDWSFLNDCFAMSGIRIGDIDGIVERRGHFLLLDGKHVGRSGQRDASDGQRTMYKRLAKTGLFTVVLFHGTPPAHVEWVRQWLPGGRFVQERKCDNAELQQIVHSWFLGVEKRSAA